MMGVANLFGDVKYGALILAEQNSRMMRRATVHRSLLRSPFRVRPRSIVNAWRDHAAVLARQRHRSRDDVHLHDAGAKRPARGTRELDPVIVTGCGVASDIRAPEVGEPSNHPWPPFGADDDRTCARRFPSEIALGARVCGGRKGRVDIGCRCCIVTRAVPQGQSGPVTDAVDATDPRSRHVDSHLLPLAHLRSKHELNAAVRRACRHREERIDSQAAGALDFSTR
jgi:hypothetical protein